MCWCVQTPIEFSIDFSICGYFFNRIFNRKQNIHLAKLLKKAIFNRRLKIDFFNRNIEFFNRGCFGIYSREYIPPDDILHEWMGNGWVALSLGKL